MNLTYRKKPVYETQNNIRQTNKEKNSCVRISVLAGTLFAVFAAGTAVSAQAPVQYPVKAIRMILPSAPGSGPDIMARSIGQKLTEAWGQPVVVEARPGAGGIIRVGGGRQITARRLYSDHGQRRFAFR